MTQLAYLRRITGCLVNMQMAVEQASEGGADAELWAMLEEQTQKIAFIVIQADQGEPSSPAEDEEGIEPEFDFQVSDEGPEI